MFIYISAKYDNKVDVAVKVIQETAELQNFESEIKLMKKFKHNNVVCFHGCVNIDTKHCIVMEYLSGGSLRGYLENFNGNEIEFSTKVFLSIGIAEGMGYLENMKVVHRDLAARNVLLTEKLTPKISDFGMSKIISNYYNYYSSTSNNVPYAHASIEVLERKKYSTKSDVWAFAVTMYEIFTLGEIPYCTTEDDKVILKKLKKGERLEVPNCYNCSDEIKNLMSSCWKTDPSARPSFINIVHKLEDIIERVYHFV